MTEYSSMDFLSDFTPLILLLLLPLVALWLLFSLKLDTTNFQIGIFFIFLLTILGFLYAMKWLLWEQKITDEALGLPAGSIRTVIALTVVFFALFVSIAKLTVAPEVVTLLTALVAFYFGATTASKPKTTTQEDGAGQTQTFKDLRDMVQARTDIGDPEKKTINDALNVLEKGAQDRTLTKKTIDDTMTSLAKYAWLTPALTAVLKDAFGFG